MFGLLLDYMNQIMQELQRGIVEIDLWEVILYGYKLVKVVIMFTNIMDRMKLYLITDLISLKYPLLGMIHLASGLNLTLGVWIEEIHLIQHLCLTQIRPILYVYQLND